MGIFSVSDERHRRLQRFRRHTWLLIAMCLLARGAGAGLEQIGKSDGTHPASVPQPGGECSIDREKSDATALETSSARSREPIHI
ncbi:hypothetical protein GCM10011614_26560 [Novosphingobium colocasiae]|uniref:Uncharacterized protein n=1 Tax=Novosphingobium colocasiae TaxID=1256513 RepID=A0A918UHR9_9SPHN|nr:hypothetical protein GCM10011614_26560 [Novosphingobium colocasiae]